ncbi:MAG: hypothetical protein BGO01_15565 [Armatimonadetes bacterium 55-13]|nr:family 10 glycosylhydrolase [Armatimonadota bacterium]OJU65280.1 MAG: hypothetical protein BGO01_15565 [Armatimonadetes bacterium 55-13]
MSILAACLATVIMADSGDPTTPQKLPTPSPDAVLHVPPPASRFSLQSPLPSLNGVMMDWVGNSYGLAQQTARSQGLQARILWIDATANIDKVNTSEKVATLVKMIRLSGFNTVVFDIKPISGQTMYPSKIAPRLAEWKGKVLPADFDPLAAMVSECKNAGLFLAVSLNAFSEGHRDFKVGPGYAKTDWQTTLYEPLISAYSIYNDNYPVNPIFNPNSVGADQISAYNDRNAMPDQGTPDMYAVALDRFGTVTASYQASNVPAARVPVQGSVLIGKGGAGTFLKNQAPINSKLRFSSVPKFVKISERPDQQVPLMVNPNNPEVQDYEESLMKEVLTNYDVDGVIYDDRLRYAGINADFSPITQQQFEKYVGRRITWPDDVFKFTISPALNRGVIPGPYYEAWMTFRAQTLRNYMLRIRKAVKATRPRTQFGLYAGSWYGEYPRLGSNWGSPDLEAGFWFLTPEYAQTGLAPLCDFFIAGCYYPTSTIYDALSQGVPIGNSVEGAAQMANRIVRDQSWTYAGIALSQFKGNPDGLRAALQGACGASQGVMVFDLSHDIEPMWQVFAQAFANDPRTPPHASVSYLAEVRRKRAQVDKLGHKEPPVIINAGSSGIGQ